MTEWGPWIEHDGRGMPPEVIGSYTHRVHRYKDGSEKENFSVSGFAPWNWDWRMAGRVFNGKQATKIIRYRIRKPRALEQLREIARDPERKLEDA